VKQLVTFTQIRTTVIEFDTIEPIGKLTLETFANAKEVGALPPGASRPGQTLADSTTPWKVAKSQPEAPAQTQVKKTRRTR
jgi:hypothetical protein